MLPVVDEITSGERRGKKMERAKEVKSKRAMVASWKKMHEGIKVQRGPLWSQVDKMDVNE